MSPIGWLFVGFGAFAICAAAFDWGFFMNHATAQMFVRMLGRKGTRIFYGLLGSAFVVVGVLVVRGILH
jgi:hypothetical protein